MPGPPSCRIESACKVRWPSAAPRKLQLCYEGAACILACVSSQRKVQRYAAYFKGWCQAFGEHENLSCEENEINWLSAENQVGFILPAQLTRALNREVLGKQRDSPTLTISQDCVKVGRFHYTLSPAEDQRGIDALRQILENPGKLHLYLTYHFLYRSGTRIITLSRKQPLGIIYKQINPMHIKLT